MFRNTSLPRECFFASLRVHNANEIRGAQRPGKPRSNVFLKSGQGDIDARNVIGSNAIKSQFMNVFPLYLFGFTYLNRKSKRTWILNGC